jgi:hypothetical protein
LELEQGAQRLAADPQPGSVGEPRSDFDDVALEHRLAGQDAFLVEEDVEHRRDAVKPKNELFSFGRARGRQADREPPIVAVEVRRLAWPPEARVGERGGRRPRDACVEPLERREP